MSSRVGFQWIDATHAADNIFSFPRVVPAAGRRLMCVSNFSPVRATGSACLNRASIASLNTGASRFGGSNVGVFDAVAAEALP